MRWSLVALAVSSPLFLVACEDGPAQPYAAAPDNAGSIWNDGHTPGSADPAKQGFATVGGQGENKQEICSGDEKAKRWGKIVEAPILPPTQGGGLDLAGWDPVAKVETWQGLTIDQAEHRPVDANGTFDPNTTDFNVGNCQSVNDGDQFGDGTQVNSWGDNGEIWVDYLVSNRKIQFMTFWPGYLGSVNATSRDGAHKYVFPINTQASMDGKPYTINWAFPVDKTFSAQLNEIYDALIATYAPALPKADCVASGACISGNFGDVAYVYIPALGLGFWVDNYHAAQPVPSTFTREDMYLAKTLGFSLGNPMLKLDAEGPVADVGKIGSGPQACTLKMGLRYGDFLSDCVQTTGDKKKDAVELSKLLGGISHSTERFSFDVQGVDLNFTDVELKSDSVIGDKDVPTPNDVATEFDLDQSTLGRIVNDRTGNDGTKDRDNHGAGLVYLEYARLVQETLYKYLPNDKEHPLGAPECTTAVAGGADYADGCTGFEGFVTCNGLPTGDPGLDLLSMGYPGCANAGLGLGLKPGHTPAAFCVDTTGDGNGYQMCTTGDIFSTSFAQVLKVLGKGKLANLPIEVQDVRFFWKQYVTALIKYFMVAGTKDETVAGVHKQFVDPDNVFFDSVGAGQFEIAEFVDRRFASKSQDPTDLSITADVKNGIFSGYTFSRDIYRGETAIYQAMLENQADGIGQENTALLTNVFGSPVLKAGWKDASSGKTAYYCATHNDPGNCDNQLPPLDKQGNLLLDEAGQPLLKPYPGAFGSSKTSFTLGSTKVAVGKLYPNIQQAMVTVPLHQNPYDPTSNALTPLQILIPWLPKQPGVGFPIPLNGQIEKFVETSQLDFSGTTISANVDYDVDPSDPSGQAIQFLAVETTDFLGNVFLCQDPATGDLLSVEMYSPVADILDWLSSHPGTYDSCGLIIRYSPFGNYADYITSLTNGVRLGITQGGGYGRVVDVTLFVPGQ